MCFYLMSLKEEIDEATKGVLIQELKKIEICDINSYALENHDVLERCYNGGIMNDHFIENCLVYGVSKQAREDYGIMMDYRGFATTYADSIASPECLVYALEKGEFSRKEIQKIPFDHGQNVETFSQRYGKENLLSELREKLLHPKPLITLEGC